MYTVNIGPSNQIGTFNYFVKVLFMYKIKYPH